YALRMRVSMSAIGSVIASPYQLDFVTPGIRPSSARSWKQILQRANFRKYARPRPHRLQRLCTREEKTLRFSPAAFARLTAFFLSSPCFSFTRRLAFASARFSSLALYTEDVLAIAPRDLQPAFQLCQTLCCSTS